MLEEFSQIDFLSYGIFIQKFVSPVLVLFTTEGFAPLLAGLMVLFTLVYTVWSYVRNIWYGQRSLSKAYRILSKVKSQEDFRENFVKIDEGLRKIGLLRHSWSEFCETLVRPKSDNDPIQVIRNTIRPSYYINTNVIIAALRLNSLHFWSNMLIGLGLLLTFIGLVAALTEAGVMIDKGGENFQEPIKKLLAVAAFKFWTSVAGLGCSIFLRLFYEFQYNSIKNKLKKINEKIELGTQFVTPEYLAIENLKEVQEQSAAMKRFSQDVAVSLAEKMQPVFSEALSPVRDSLKDIGDRITGGIGEAIKGAAGSEMEMLSRNLGSIVESLNSSKAEMDGIGSSFRVAMTEAADALKSASGQASNEMTQRLQDVIGTMSEESRKQTQVFESLMKNLTYTLDQASENAGQKVMGSATALASGMNGISDGVRDAAGAMAGRMTNLSEVLQTLEERMNKHVLAMDSITGRTKDTEQAMGSVSRHLSEAAQPIASAANKMAITAEQLNQAIQGSQRSFNETHQSLMGLASKMEETQKILQNSWQSYDNRFASVDESLAKAVYGIVQNVSDHISSMEKFVIQIDQKLGHAVQSFGNNLEELNETAETFEQATGQLLNSVNQLVKDKKAA